MGKRIQERRSHRRRPAKLTGHVGPPGQPDTVQIRTYDISCSGVRCEVPCYIAPFTQLQIAMTVPLRDGKRLRNEKISVDGTVVRTEPEKRDPASDFYHIAIFFSRTTEEARSIIAQYVSQHT